MTESIAENILIELWDEGYIDHNVEGLTGDECLEWEHSYRKEIKNIIEKHLEEKDEKTARLRHVLTDILRCQREKDYCGSCADIAEEALDATKEPFAINLLKTKIEKLEESNAILLKRNGTLRAVAINARDLLLEAYE